jgi:Flp pilus assembly CpaE family ATPase
VASLWDMLRSRPRDDRVDRAIRDGERYLRERQWVAAERAFDYACQQNPLDPRAYLGLAVLHRARGELASADESFGAFRSAVEGSGLPPAERAVMLARAYERLGSIQDARRYWEDAAEADPSLLAPHEALARLLETGGHLEAAGEHYRWLAEHEPGRADWLRALSRVQLALGDVTAAAEAREGALRLTDNDADRLVDTFELARLHRQLGELDLALQELTTCATLDPNWPDVQRELGYLHLQRADWAAARRALEDYVARAPNAPDRESVQRQAAALLGAPDVEEATDELPHVGAAPAAAPPPTTQAPIVVVYGLQGGVGRSTLVANLGLWLAQGGERVALLDLAHPTGQLALHLDLHPVQGLAELARELGENLLDWQVVSRALVKHPSGVSLLVGSTSPLTAELLTETLLQRVLPMLQLNFGWLLVDAAGDVSERTLCLLERARLALLVASPDLAGFQAMRGAIQVCDTLQLPARRRRLIWHATRGQGSQLDSRIPEWFPLETHRFLPHAGDDLRSETQLGQPLVQRKPRHRWTRELVGLAEEFAIQ